MAEVIISYARADAPRVEPIAKALQARGFDVFWQGDAAPDVAGQHLAAACAVVAVWSQASVAAPVPPAISAGKDREILVPVFLDPVPPPAGYAHIQGENLTGYPAPPADAAFDRFATSLQSCKTAVAAAAAEARQATKNARSRTLKVVAVAVAVVAAGLLLPYLQAFLPQDRQQPDPEGGPLGAEERYGLSDPEIAGLAPEALVNKALENSSYEALDAAATEDKLSRGLLCLAQRYGAETRDDAAAAQTCARASAQGTSVATYVLSLMTRAGEGGLKADPAAADALLKQAADAGDSRAQHDVASAQRVARPAAARAEAEKCAAQGNLDCRFLYAQMQAAGEGGRKDLAAAKTAYDALEAEFYPPAIRELGKFYRDGVGVNRDIGEAVTRFQRAAVFDDGEASFLLGQLAETGTGMPKSKPDAIAFYEEAKRDGYAPADAAIARLRGAKK